MTVPFEHIYAPPTPPPPSPSARKISVHKLAFTCHPMQAYIIRGFSCMVGSNRIPILHSYHQRILCIFHFEAVLMCLSLSHFSNGQFILVDTCSSRSGNQYSADLVGSGRHMIQHDYLQFLLLLYFICCCYCLQKLMYTD